MDSPYCANCDAMTRRPARRGRLKVAYEGYHVLNIAVPNELEYLSNLMQHAPEYAEELMRQSGIEHRRVPSTFNQLQSTK